MPAPVAKMSPGPQTTENPTAVTAAQAHKAVNELSHALMRASLALSRTHDLGLDNLNYVGNTVLRPPFDVNNLHKWVRMVEETVDTALTNEGFWSPLNGEDVGAIATLMQMSHSDPESDRDTLSARSE